MNKRIRLAIIAPVGVVLLIVTALSAQQQYQQAPPPQEDAQATISEQELDKAALAFSRVAKISEELQSSLQTTESQEQRQEMQQIAQSSMIQEVEKAGLTVERYNEIIQYAQTSEETWLPFQEKVKALSGKKQTSDK